MTFEVADYYQLIALLHQHPEWRDELRKMLLSQDILELPQIVARLARAQEQSEARLAGVEERLTRLEQTVAELAEAQKRTEQRVEELAQAQKRTDEKVDRLGAAVGQLNRAFGSTVEEEAASVGGVVFQKQGYRLDGEPFSLPIDGEGEVDVVMPLRDAKGKRVWALVEAKARLSQRDVLRWAQRLRSPAWRAHLAEQGVEGPYLPYCYAIRFDLGARQALEEEGIGLLKSEGEVLPPRAPIVP